MATTTVWYRTKNLAGAHGSSPTSITDETGNGQHATISGATVTTSDSTYVGKSITGTTMAVSIPTTMGGLGLVDGTYVEVKGPHQATFVAANLADGDAATLWSNLATALPITIQYRVRTGAGADTFTTATYNEYTVKNGGTAANSPTAWTFQGSNNGTSWTTLHTVTGATTTANTATTHSFSNSTAYEYYKWVITANNGGTSVEWLQASPTGLSTGKQQYDGSIFIVVKRSATDSTSAWRLGTSGQQSHYTFSGTVYDDTGTTVRRSFTPSLAVTSHRIVEFRVVGTTYEAFIDNVSQLSASSVTKGWELWQPAVFVSYNGTWTEFKAIKYGSGDTPATVAGTEYTALYNEHMAAPPVTASATSAASVTATAVVGRETTASVTSAGAVTASAGDYSGTASVSSAASVTATAALGKTATASVSSAGTASATGETTGELDQSEIVVVPITTGFDTVPRVLLTPVPLPSGYPVEWPITRQAHLMAALSAANPSPTPYEDYDVERDEVGRLHTFVGGVDVTFLRNDSNPLYTRYADYKSSLPLGPDEATLVCPGWKPWDESGVGDLSMFTPDAPFEIVMVRPDDSLEHKWEGFFSSEGDSSGENREEYTFHAEGIFAQAMHELYDPPVYMAPTDPLHIVADVLNSVTHRRWNPIPRVDSTLPKIEDRGRPGGSKWQRVQDVLSKAITTDGRQYTLQRVAPYTYRIVLKPEVITADWTVTKGAPGIACSFVEDQANRRDRIYGRGFAPDGGYWEGRVFPGLEFGVPPLYPMAGFANIDVGTTDGDTTTGSGVTDWQRQMRELGYPVTVDGVMNSNDTQWVTKIQRDRGLTVDGSLGPQTWAATWENNSTDVDLTSYRLPLATLPGAEPFLYSATGAIIGENPADDPSMVVHAMPEIDFGSGIKKSKAIPQARIILEREQDPGVQVRVTMLTDQHETGASRFDIEPLQNLEILGHRGSTLFQLSEVSVDDLAVNLTGDTKARDHLAVQALLEKNEQARRDISSRSGTRDVSSLNKSSVVQYESESKAGFVPRTAINGDSGLWTIRKTFVSQVGVAKVEFTATGPLSELVVGLFNRPIRTSVLESLVGDPLASADGWYDAVETLQEDYGLMEVFGTPDNPGGYWPRQKGDGSLTGKLRDSSSSLYDSPYGGFVWVAMFTSQSCWVEGRVFPAVPT